MVYTRGMKTTLTPWLAPLLCAGLLAATPENQPLQRQFSWIDAGDPAAAEVRRLGEAMIQQTGNNLVSEVHRVLAAKGPEAGLADLHLKSLKLPAGLPGQPRVTAVKRTSLKVREPANLPDNADLAALLSIQSALADGDAPPRLLLQQLAADGTAPAEWRVYRPIATSAACLACHGPADQLAPGVKAALDRLYPADKAVDYAASEWRGVIRVSIVTPGDPAPKKTP